VEEEGFNEVVFLGVDNLGASWGQSLLRLASVTPEADETGHVPPDDSRHLQLPPTLSLRPEIGTRMASNILNQDGRNLPTGAGCRRTRLTWSSF
jgi:hypothetical protein